MYPNAVGNVSVSALCRIVNQILFYCKHFVMLSLSFVFECTFSNNLQHSWFFRYYYGANSQDCVIFWNKQLSQQTIFKFKLREVKKWIINGVQINSYDREKKDFEISINYGK